MTLFVNDETLGNGKRDEVLGDEKAARARPPNSNINRVVTGHAETHVDRILGREPAMRADFAVAQQMIGVANER